MQMSREPEDLELPPPLADALRAAYSHQVQVPDRVNDSILSTAHARFAQRRRLRLIARWGTGVAAGLAAVITLVVLLRPAPLPSSIAKGDVNTDGQVNMVDAFALARHLAAGDKLDRAWDVNGDGKIDQADVQALATAAVSLKQSGLATRLPRLHELGIDRPVGLASASGSSSTRNEVSLAQATRGEKGDRR
jgi:hypothetical protein